MDTHHKRGFGPLGVIFYAFFTFAAITCAGTYSGGSGTAEEPYKISTVGDWQELIGASADWDKVFVLTVDLDFGGMAIAPLAADTTPDNGYFEGKPFTGVFDGAGHTLSNAILHQPDNDFVGLFACVSEPGLVRNLGVEGIHVSGRSWVGGLCGINEATITDCFVIGTIQASQDLAGGLCGQNTGDIISCYAITGTSGNNGVGGLCGDNISGTLRQSHSQGTVTGLSHVGGLCGSNYLGTILACFSASSVSGPDASSYLGGLCGSNYGSIKSCYATGSVTGGNRSSRLGGLCGYQFAATISSCYATGAIGGGETSKDIGGFCGDNSNSTIHQCYSTGQVTRSTGNYDVGGFCGAYYYSTVSQCFWDTETSGLTYSVGIGRKTAQMKTLSTFTQAGWDFEDLDGDPPDWQMPANDYPRLEWEPIPAYSGGQGTEADPYLLATSADWVYLLRTFTDWNKHFRMTSVIDLGGVVLSPVSPDTGTAAGYQGIPFRGTLDGAGQTLTHVNIFSPSGDYVGLFGSIAPSGQIRNLRVEDPNITGRQWVGGIAGENSGTIEDCRVSGGITCIVSHGGGVAGKNAGTIRNCGVECSIEGPTLLGGLCGLNSGTLVGSVSRGPVTGGPQLGGLCGMNENGAILISYASGSVTGEYMLGGLVGLNQGRISACYATGVVRGEEGNPSCGGLCGDNFTDTIDRCFWDTQTTLCNRSAGGGIGLSTEQMTNRLLFQNAGWGGTEWVMKDGVDFPRLAWEQPDSAPIPGLKEVPFSGGGTETDPYLIRSPEAFASLSWYSALYDRHFRMVADLDLQGLALNPVGILGPFTGHFDGNGYTIRNATLHFPKEQYVGLFGKIGEGGEVRNLTVDTISVMGNDYTGGLCGINRGILNACSVSGSISGGDASSGIAGLCGDNLGTIQSCTTKVTLVGEQAVGGLCGYNSGTLLSSCARGRIVGEGMCYTIGGACGHNYHGVIQDCFADVTLDGVNNAENFGGFCGLNNGGEISDCYARGSVSCGRYSWDLGGLCGSHYDGTIRRCYATVFVEAGTESFRLGGLCGYSKSGLVENSWWDAETTGLMTSAGGTGLAKAEMKTQATFAGWDFANTWAICEGTNYPRLKWQIPATDWVCPDGVELEDLVYLAGRWMATTPETIGAADGNGDGKVDLSDFEILADNWMRM